MKCYKHFSFSLFWRCDAIFSIEMISLMINLFIQEKWHSQKRNEENEIQRKCTSSSLCTTSCYYVVNFNGTSSHCRSYTMRSIQIRKMISSFCFISFVLFVDFHYTSVSLFPNTVNANLLFEKVNSCALLVQ